jgi:RimJ/RimL family protein N-acetyltransferase
MCSGFVYRRTCYDVSVTRTESVLKTPRLRLAPVTDGDIAALVRHFSEPQIQRYLCDDLPVTYDRVNAIATTSDRDFSVSRFGIWAMHSVEHAAAIGICGLRSMSGAAAVELLFSVRPRYAKQGYAFEAAAAVLDYGFDLLGFDQVFAVCEADNPAAASILRRLGMQPLAPARAGNTMIDFVIRRGAREQRHGSGPSV